MAKIEFGVLGGQAIIVVSGKIINVNERSGGQFSSDPMDVLAHWPAFEKWARGVEATGTEADVDYDALDCPVPKPTAIYGIGLNYADHAKEAGLEFPKQPMVFAKYPCCITDATADITLTSNRVDFEAELVVAISREAHKISEEDAMSYVAGYSVGQDISDRRQQFSDKPPQFCLGKSAPGYGPCGPVLVTTDGFADPHDIALNCFINDEQVQNSSTKHLIFNVPQLVSFLSQWCILQPGDLIFTGTPAGVGAVRTPRRYLQPGEVITTNIEGIGQMRNTCV
ncbi:fumarylacetoacetate hydrolase family protein [Pacificibacter sp. AS14]|uniref:fumarylacetoacetate hydrolase family protein n=1 Tax=Pacificibacter sp. AS14 TaxID=3135785 RepID=UPI0031823FCC